MIMQKMTNNMSKYKMKVEVFDQICKTNVKTGQV